MTEYILYLEPTSLLNHQISTFLKESSKLFGPNESHFYQPHVSMTGFWRMNQSRQEDITQFLNSNLPIELNPLVDSPIIVHQSHLLLPITQTDCLHELTRNLMHRFQELPIRKKEINHISLGYGEGFIECTKQYELAIQHFKEINKIQTWDIVFYSIEYRSLVIGVPHPFKEIARWSCPTHDLD